MPKVSRKSKVESLKSKGAGSANKTQSQPTSVVKKKQTGVASHTEPRQLPLPERFWYKPWTWWQNLPAPPREPLPKARIILKLATQQLFANWKLFGGIVIVYGILNILLVRGFSNTTDLSSFKSAIDGLVSGVAAEAKSTLVSFVYVLTTSGGGATAASGAYQTLLLVASSLAFIWALRQTSAKQLPRIRDSFYSGMAPLVPFGLILLTMSVQFIPLVGGSYLYSLAVQNGIATDIGEKLSFGLVALLLGLWSLRMITGSLFALYIVTLPGMAPMRALRSAKQLVYKRRLLIWRKLVVLPVVLLLAAFIVELPLILWLPAAAEWVLFAFNMVALAFVHGYLYTLYREML